MATSADATSPPPFRERLAWDPERGEIRDGEIRYLLIRPDALMGAVLHLPPEMRATALAAFAASVHRHGGGSARKYRGMGAADPDALLQVVAATAPQLGWGRWRFEEAGPGRLRLEVENSPFAAGHGAAEGPVCAPIAGMLRAVAELVLGGEAAVRETDCAAAGAACCRFEAMAAGTGGAA